MQVTKKWHSLICSSPILSQQTNFKPSPLNISQFISQENFVVIIEILAVTIKANEICPVLLSYKNVLDLPKKFSHNWKPVIFNYAC